MDTSIEYTAQVTSPLINGEAKLKIEENSFSAASLPYTADISYAEVNQITFADYVVTVTADSGIYTFSRMGEWAQRFYDALCDTYNGAVLRSLFISGSPLITAKGNYHYTENGSVCSGTAPVYVFGNSVAVLPPDIGARRIPLCFVSGIEKGGYSTTLKVNNDPSGGGTSGDSYTFSKLGYDTAPFEAGVEKQMRILRENALSAIKELDPSLTAMPASQLAKLMPEGAAAPVKQIASIAPSFYAALESNIAKTSSAEYYNALAEICDASQVWVGFRKSENLFWLIAPSPDGQYAAVEFLEPGSATFVYRTCGNFTAFAKKLNLALEAISFKREVIRLSDEELRKPDNADYYMASKRTAALQFVRANFAGRVIHTDPDAWKRRLTELWSG